MQAAEQLERLRVDIIRLLGAEEHDDGALVQLAAFCDEIEFLLMGSELMLADEPADTERIRSWFLGEDLNEQILAALARSFVSDPDVEKARGIEEKRRRARGVIDRRAHDDMRQRALAIVSLADADLAQLLTKLGGSPTSAPRAAFAALVARIDDVAASERLHDAWTAMRAKRVCELAAVVDAHVDHQRPLVRPTNDTDGQVDEFLRELLDVAVADADVLESELRIALPGASRPLDHVGRLAFSKMRGQAELSVPLYDSLDVAARHLSRLLDLDVRVLRKPHITIHLSRRGQLLGEILMDPWEVGSANRTVAVRNRTDHSGLQQYPIAYVRCGLRPRGPHADRVSVQALHSVLHELGHGVQHILVPGVLPALSGMDRLPLDRRETMALWCEKLLYRPGFDLPQGWRTVKALEARRGLVERTVLALIDRAVLGTGSERSVVAAFERWDRSHGVARYCSLVDVLEHFAEDIPDTSGGTYYSYALAAAESCAMATARPSAPWFDPELPLPLPRPTAITDFYRNSARDDAAPRDSR